MKNLITSQPNGAPYSSRAERSGTARCAPAAPRCVCSGRNRGRASKSRIHATLPLCCRSTAPSPSAGAGTAPPSAVWPIASRRSRRPRQSPAGPAECEPRRRPCRAIGSALRSATACRCQLPRRRRPHCWRTGVRAAPGTGDGRLCARRSAVGWTRGSAARRAAVRSGGAYLILYFLFCSDIKI